jgi:hypothetical protein
MTYWKHLLRVWVALTWALGVSVTSAQQLNPQQLQIIRDTATSVCNTIRDVKGQKNDLQIQGEVKTQLGGLIGKVFDVGGSGKGSLSREEFEGLSRDATATALEGDRGCRERVFNRMFDKLGTIPQLDSKNSYIAGGRRSDLRTVREFVANRRFYDDDVPFFLRGRCWDNVKKFPSKINIDDNNIRIVNIETMEMNIPNNKCPARTDVGGVECSASISDLDDILSINEDSCRRNGGCVSVIIKCLSGGCAYCATQGSNPLQVRHDSLEVRLGSTREISRGDLNTFVRTLSRIISSGSDESLCRARPDYCW